jgi:hypothetical protein
MRHRRAARAPSGCPGRAPCRRPPPHASARAAPTSRKKVQASAPASCGRRSSSCSVVSSVALEVVGRRPRPAAAVPSGCGARPGWSRTSVRLRQQRRGRPRRVGPAAQRALRVARQPPFLEPADVAHLPQRRVQFRRVRHAGPRPKAREVLGQAQRARAGCQQARRARRRRALAQAHASAPGAL